MFDRVRQAMGAADSLPDGPYVNTATDPEAAAAADVSNASSLSWDTRVQCFAGCFILSIVASLCASFLLFLGNISGFCILTAMGSALSLVGTCFLMGPANQCRKMFDASRWLASLVYIACIAMALVSGLVLSNPPLAVIFTIGMYLAMAWYSLSYIPYARDMVRRVVCSCIGN